MSFREARSGASWSIGQDGSLLRSTGSATTVATVLPSSSSGTSFWHRFSVGEGGAPSALRKWSRRQEELLCQQLVVLLRSGVGVVEGLRALQMQADRTSALVIDGILAHLEAGMRLADAFERTCRCDPLLIALLRAAEHTSDTAPALERFLDHRHRVTALQQRVVTTAIYPSILMVVGVTVLLFLLIIVVPRFSGIFQTMNVELPWAAGLMLAWGSFVREHAMQALAMALLLPIMMVGLAASPVVRGRLYRFAERNTTLGRNLRILHLARYYRTIASLVGGGIPLPQSMGMANELLPTSLQGAGSDALARIIEGVAPAAALRSAGLTTPIADKLILAGQRNGQIGAMFGRCADFHDDELGRGMERLMRALEPTVMAAIGLAIGVVVVLMYLPIFELASAVR